MTYRFIDVGEVEPLFNGRIRPVRKSAALSVLHLVPERGPLRPAFDFYRYAAGCSNLKVSVK